MSAKKNLFDFSNYNFCAECLQENGNDWCSGDCDWVSEQCDNECCTVIVRWISSTLFGIPFCLPAQF